MTDDEILEARASGKSVERIARDFQTTVEAINRTLDAYSQELLSEPALKRSLMVELMRLDRLHEVFYAKALAGDVSAGMLVTKLIQRRSLLLGLEPVAGFATVVISKPAQHQSSSTAKIRDTLNTLLGVDPQRDADQEGDKVAELPARRAQ
jgi:hypothetical protein